MTLVRIKMKRKLGNTEIEDINATLIICGGFSLVCLGYLIYLLTKYDFGLFPFFTIPLLAGVIIENNRLQIDKKMLSLKIMLGIILASMAVLFFSLTSGQIITLLKNWPYFFIISFAIISAIYHDKKVTPKITEGVTLLQSISLLYCILDFNYFEFSNFFEAIILISGIGFSLFSFHNAFSLKVLTRKTRLILSIWSSFIMAVFAGIYMYRVYNFNHLTGNVYIDYFIAMLQYFFLGISSIYIVQNFRMIAVYFAPNNGYDNVRKKNIERMNKLHICRYSAEQVEIKNSVLLSTITFMVYSFNYFFNFLPSLTLIWLVFWLAPILIALKENYNNKEKNELEVYL